MAGLRNLWCAIAVASCILVVANAAISCGTVSSKLAPCIPYLKQGGPSPPPACCSGVKQLNGLAQTTPDRQQACQCLQNAAKGISGLKTNLAASLPSACGVNIPYPISLSTNCNSVK